MKKNDNLSNMNLSNPVSTGGAGVHFESKVGAFYLAQLLMDSIPKGFDSGKIIEVAFQLQFQQLRQD